MAEVNKSVLGSLRGALGDVVYRQKNDKCFASVRPGSFLPGTDKDSVLRRDSFSAAVKITGAINSLPSLKSIWSINTPNNMRTYDYIMKCVYPRIKLPVIQITPDFHFSFNTKRIQILDTEIIINTEFRESFLADNQLSAHSVKMAGIVYLSNPISENIRKCTCLPFESLPKQLTMENRMEFRIPFQKSNLENIGYQFIKCFCSMIVYDADGNISGCSESFY